MRPRQLLIQYLNGQIGVEEMRIRLSEGGSREARKALDMLNMDECFRQVLLNFRPPTNAQHRLVEQVVAVESWIQTRGQKANKTSSDNWWSRLIPSFDVVGHEFAVKKKEKKVTSRKQK